MLLGQCHDTQLQAFARKHQSWCEQMHNEAELHGCRLCQIGCWPLVIGFLSSTTFSCSPCLSLPLLFFRTHTHTLNRAVPADTHHTGDKLQQKWGVTSPLGDISLAAFCEYLHSLQAHLCSCFTLGSRSSRSLPCERARRLNWHAVVDREVRLTFDTNLSPDTHKISPCFANLAGSNHFWLQSCYSGA